MDGQHLAHHARKHQPARRGPARGHAHGQAPPRAKVRRQRRDARAKQAPVAQPHADAQREQYLPVLRGDGHGEDAEDLEGHAEREDVAEIAGVAEPAGQGAHKEEEEDLAGADPGDVRGRPAEGGGVVGLEQAEGADDAPGVHDDEMGAGD